MRSLSAVAVLLLVSVETLIPGYAALGQNLRDPIPQSGKDGAYFSLSVALDQSLLQSPRAAAARAQLPITRSNYLQATVMPNPTFIYLQNFKADKVQELGVQIPVEPPWKLAFRLLAAKRQVSQTDLEIIRSLWLLRAEIRRAYLDVVIAQEVAALQTQLLEIYRQLQNAAEERYKAGGVALVEVEKARLATEQAEIEQDRQAQKVILAKQHLNIIMGRLPDFVLDVPRLELAATVDKTRILPDFDAEPRPLNDFIALAAKSSLDLKVLAQSVKVNQANLATAIGNIAPNPVLSFGHLTAIDIGTGSSNQGNSIVTGDQTASGLAPVNNQGNNVTKGYFVGVNVDVSVFDFQQGNISRLRATIKQLRAEQLAQQNIVSDQVAAAYRRLVIARRVARAYRERVLGRAAKVVKMNQESYQYGRSDITSALVGAQLNIQTQTQYLSAIAEYQTAMTDLEQAVGTPLD